MYGILIRIRESNPYKESRQGRIPYKDLDRYEQCRIPRKKSMRMGSLVRLMNPIVIRNAELSIRNLVGRRIQMHMMNLQATF